MFKKFMRKHGVEMVVMFVLFCFFLLGFLCGRSVNADTSEEKAAEQTAIETNVAAVELPNEEKPAGADQPKSIEVVATAYCPCEKCCGKTDGITATGTKATAGRTIAVDPSIIPYGTEIVIDGITYIAEDCGGAVKGNKVDIFFGTHEEALQFGKRVLTAYIFE